MVAEGQLLIAKFPTCAKSTGIKVSGTNPQKLKQLCNYVILAQGWSYSISNVGFCIIFPKQKGRSIPFRWQGKHNAWSDIPKKGRIFARRTTILWEAFKRNLQKNNLDQPVGLQKLRKWFYLYFSLLLAKGYNLVAPLVACPTANAALPRREKDRKYTDEWLKILIIEYWS